MGCGSLRRMLGRVVVVVVGRLMGGGIIGTVVVEDRFPPWRNGVAAAAAENKEGNEAEADSSCFVIE